MSSVLKLCYYEFQVQMKSNGTWLGYMVGFVLIINHYFSYIQYAQDIGESINVLEPFLVAANNPNTIVFLILGWLLVISGVPFIDHISYYAIYRTKRKTWNCAMILYICLQAVLYYLILLVVTILTSMKNGYFANIWSYTIRKVISNVGNEYNINFPYEAFVSGESVYVSVIHTLALAVGYAVLMGLLTYIVSLISKRNIGPVIGVLFHFLGYEIMKEGLGITIHFSLLARSIPALQIGEDALTGILDTYIVYAIILMLLFEISQKLIQHIDFRFFCVVEEEE